MGGKWRPWPYSILYIHRMKEKDFRPMSIATTDITFMYLFTYFYPVLSPTRKSFSITSKSLPIHLLATSLILTSAAERPKVVANPIPKARAHESKRTIQLKQILSHIEHYNTIDTKSLESVISLYQHQIVLLYQKISESKTLIVGHQVTFRHPQ